MGYNLLKSLYIKAGKTGFEYTVNLIQKGCILTIDTHSNNLYTVSLEFCYAPDVEIGLTPQKSSKVTDVSYILNNSINGTIKEDGFNSLVSLLKSFDNVIYCGHTFHIFQVDDFSLKLSQELYSVPADMSSREFNKCQYHCEKLSDFGVRRGSGSSLSVIEIALKLLDGMNVVYEDEQEKYKTVVTASGKTLKLLNDTKDKHKERYKIVLSDRGKALITRYKIAKIRSTMFE